MSPVSAKVSRTTLDSGWEWKQRDPSVADVVKELQLPHDVVEKTGEAEAGTKQAWLPAKVFPSEVHAELLKNGLIPDPFVGFNEHKVQWIGEVEWLYTCPLPNIDPGRQSAVLEFQGLDTLCDIYVNERLLLSVDNMFQTHLVRVPKNVLKTSNNVVLLHFKSAAKLAKEFEAEMGRVRAGSTNLGDPSRVYVRKAQYGWRWDWGPELMTCGPYRPITLSVFDLCIHDVNARALVSANLSRKLKVDVELSLGESSQDPLKNSKLRVTLKGQEKTVMRTAEIPIKDRVLDTVHDSDGITAVNVKNVIDWELDDKVKLWWPVGYGEQALYDIEVELIGESQSEPIDIHTQRTGFRRVKLIQDDLQEADQYGKGKTFLFEINGVRMFMGGSNWIPASSNLTTLTDERYRAWLTLLRDGNQKMVRIWGGGVYEPEIFYETCDELGLLVWQDFQFACGVYPAHDAFVKSVKKEAEDNVKRMRKHPSIAVWCGNNEDYQMVLQWGDVPHLPATLIYEHVLPSVVAALTGDPDPNFKDYERSPSDIPQSSTLSKSTLASSQPSTPANPTPFPYKLSSDYQTPYHPGSPYGGVGWDTADPTIGDVHQWNVWGGKELPWQSYDVLGGRFVSEFGMPSMPCMETIEAWMGKPRPEKFVGDREWNAQSKVMAQHCRAGAFERRFAIAMNDNFRLTEDLEVAVYNTQLMQAESMAYAYSVWRRKWGGPGKEYTAGVLVWQSNDCWPVTSWAIADYFLRPKPAFFTIARQLAPVALGVSRTVVKNRPNDRPRQFYEFGAFQSVSATLDVWGMNSGLEPITASLELHFVDLNSDWEHKEQVGSVTLLPNQSTDLLVGVPCRGPPKNPEQEREGAGGNFDEWTGCTSSTVVVGVRLLDSKTREVLARCADWPQPFRFVNAPSEPGLGVVVKGSSGEITVSVKKPVKCVVFNVVGEGGGLGEVRWGDNALDLMPGDPQKVKVIGDVGKKHIRAAWFGNEKGSKVDLVVDQ
ncbi:glycoside hydrolase [Dendrothele bispora CBS 962.96]|uniref:beta-mannosidase n=1 Tax=Dendrothele bispora (strain CBS 962.96) TaxID=1314807 RepID=A0A4S8KP79_DENBC|nr:glycoside hydrolase [Dendrothele bispora CBS 962.96]